MIGADVVKYADHGTSNAVAEAFSAIYMDNAPNKIFPAMVYGVMGYKALPC